jgi:hypothetical protein
MSIAIRLLPIIGRVVGFFYGPTDRAYSICSFRSSGQGPYGPLALSGSGKV